MMAHTTPDKYTTSNDMATEYCISQMDQSISVSGRATYTTEKESTSTLMGKDTRDNSIRE